MSDTRTLYRHYKGGLYVKLHVAKWHDAAEYENGPDKYYVVYQAVRATASGSRPIYARPLLEFEGFIDERNLERRFAPIGAVPA